ncbi:hypothetical protein [Nocardia ignorata]|uniref:Uncharacterized protein n=1 Tax=Nocardia ignorata TaxID=145285 RepID=A0A4R6P3L1_NOCIG|nr:hypothetical protein [Nocardia ignorata]TDP29901.1 hypothetical protein DFR75_112170 [Nocardia ignorata]
MPGLKPTAAPKTTQVSDTLIVAANVFACGTFFGFVLWLTNWSVQ